MSIFGNVKYYYYSQLHCMICNSGVKRKQRAHAQGDDDEPESKRRSIEVSICHVSHDLM